METKNVATQIDLIVLANPEHHAVARLLEGLGGQAGLGSSRAWVNLVEQHKWLVSIGFESSTNADSAFRNVALINPVGRTTRSLPIRDWT